MLSVGLAAAGSSDNDESISGRLAKHIQMGAEGLSFAVGQHATSNPQEAVMRCWELHSCGILRRKEFLKGVQSTGQQLQPFTLFSLVYHCLNAGLLGFELLQVLLPEPLHASRTIQEACCSYASTQQLLLQASTTAHTCSSRSPPCTTAVLQQLMAYTCSLQRAGSADSNFATQQDASLDDYLLQLVQHLQEASYQNEVLALCLFQAAAACHALVDKPFLARWTKQQLQGLVYTATCKDRQPCTIMSTAWGATFLRHCCWHTILPISIKSLEVRELLQIYEQHMTAATAHPQAFGRMCGMLAAVGACGHSASVLDMLSCALSAQLKEGHLREIIALMLLAQNLLDSKEYVQTLQIGAMAALTGDASAGVAGGWSVLLRAMNMLLYAATLESLQAHAEVLRHLLPGAAASMQQKVKETLEMVQSAVMQKQQEQKKQAATDKPLVKLTASMRSDLEQFRSQPAINGRRQLSEYQRTRWRMYRGTVTEWAQALALNPPDSTADACVRWEFLKALEDLNLGSYNGTNLNTVIQSSINQLLQTCHAVGVDVMGNRQVQAAGPMEQLQQMLDRLPGAAGAAGQQPWALRSLMTRITQQLRQVLGHSQQQGPGMPSADERPTKKQCTVAGKGAEVQDAMNCSPELKQHLVHLLVKAYQCVGCQPGRSNRTWQLEFCNLLQEVQQLHGPLLQQLLHSVQGRHADEGQSQDTLLAHAQLLALLAAAEPTQILLLQPDSQDSLAQVPVAVSQSIWTACTEAGCLCSSACTCSALARTGCAGERVQTPEQRRLGTAVAYRTISGQWQVQQHSLTGFQLLDWLISHTSISSDKEAYSAAAFWTAYVMGVGHMGSWCAGPYGPFKWRSTHPTDVVQQRELLGYMPPQLLALLRTLQQHFAASGSSFPEPTGATCSSTPATTAQRAHKVLSAAFHNKEPLKWLDHLQMGA